MQTNPHDPLNEVEHRLSEWQPATRGLDSDKLLYEAGLQAGQQQQNARPLQFLALACIVLAVGSASLFVWGWAEYSQRQTLAQELKQHQLLALQARAVPTIAITANYVPESNNYLHLRRQAEHHPSEWPISLSTGNVSPPYQPIDIPSASQFDRFLDR